MATKFNNSNSQNLNIATQQSKVLSQNQIYILKLIQKSIPELRNDIFQKLVENPTLELVSDAYQNEISIDDTDNLNHNNEILFDEENIDSSENISNNRASKELLNEFKLEEINSDKDSIENQLTDKNTDELDNNSIAMRSENDLNTNSSDRNDLNDEYYSDSYYNNSQNYKTVTRKDILLENYTYSQNLHDYLIQQLRMVESDQTTRKIAEIIIGNIDERGYFTSKISDIKAELSFLKISESQIKNALELIQRFDPVGVGARDLRECILIQLAKLNKKDTTIWKVVENHLDLLANKKINELAKILKTSPQEIKKIANNIAQLNPIPAIDFQQLNSYDYIIPDVIATLDKKKDIIKVELNESGIPKIQISHNYRDIMLKNRGNQKIENYFKEKFQDGKLFINHIQNRNQTILKIATAICELQKEFIEKGSYYIKPLTMKEVAKKVKIHESTVSRAVANKYLKTSFGIFSLRTLFSTGYKETKLKSNNFINEISDDKEIGNNFTKSEEKNEQEISSQSIKDRIKIIIKNENTKKPLSDQKISQILNQEGIKIARRTISKYREQLRILPAHLRKSF